MKGGMVADLLERGGPKAVGWDVKNSRVGLGGCKRGMGLEGGGLIPPVDQERGDDDSI